MDITAREKLDKLLSNPNPQEEDWLTPKELVAAMIEDAEKILVEEEEKTNG